MRDHCLDSALASRVVHAEALLRRSRALDIIPLKPRDPNTHVLCHHSTCTFWHGVVGFRLSTVRDKTWPVSDEPLFGGWYGLESFFQQARPNNHNLPAPFRWYSRDSAATNVAEDFGLVLSTRGFRAWDGVCRQARAGM